MQEARELDWQITKVEDIDDSPPPAPDVPRTTRRIEVSLPQSFSTDEEDEQASDDDGPQSADRTPPQGARRRNGVGRDSLDWDQSLSLDG